MSPAVAEVSIYSQFARFSAARQRFQQDTGRTVARKLPVGIAISVVFHAVAVIWVATHQQAVVLAAPHSRMTTVEILPPSTREPVAIAFLDEPTTRALEHQPAAITATTAAPTRRRDHGSAAFTTGHATGGETPGREPVGSGSSFMKMRGPEIDQGPSQSWVDDFLDRSKPLEKELEPSGELHPSGNGRYRSHQGPFDLDVERDGTAHITDGKNFHVESRLPSRKSIGDGLTAWKEDPYGAGGKAGENQVKGEYHTIGDDDKPQSSNIVSVPILGGGFDATDWVMRSHGQDPYASKKLAVLDATRDERAQIGTKHRHDQLAHATQLMQKNLGRVGALDPASRKQALFELWDECAETGDADLVKGGRAARSLVIGFVRANLRGPDAYTPAELSQLNTHRQSTATFSPYE